MNTKFKKGDAVQHKSGGPKMIVVGFLSVQGEDTVECEWFEGNKPETKHFTPEALKLFEPPALGVVVSRE
jgi:uncharacterized protein YodC (DUF2158 family)